MTLKWERTRRSRQRFNHSDGQGPWSSARGALGEGKHTAFIPNGDQRAPPPPEPEPAVPPPPCPNIVWVIIQSFHLDSKLIPLLPDEVSASREERAAFPGGAAPPGSKHPLSEFIVGVQRRRSSPTSAIWAAAPLPASVMRAGISGSFPIGTLIRPLERSGNDRIRKSGRLERSGGGNHPPNGGFPLAAPTETRKR